MTQNQPGPIEIDAELVFSASPAPPSSEFSAHAHVGDGFNEYGVRQNRDDNGNLLSIDVLYRAMEAGLRKNVRITPEFLQGVAASFSGPKPLQYDHSQSQLANVGTVQQVWAADNALWLMGNIPNTGSSIRSDTIADFTYQPPAITDGSVGFGRDYEVVYDETTDEYVFEDAMLAEFSLTPFPAGYDTGGLSPAFCEAATEVGLFADVDDADAENAADAVAEAADPAENSEVDAESKSPASGRSYARISDL